ncbi:MAG TPA: hypothetical protein DIW43_04460 [Spongiibacteraceae bacterium]|nr:hypothetical protein [Spongiibacteraceae bacterium]
MRKRLGNTTIQIGISCKQEVLMFKRSLAGVALVIGLGTASLSHALSLGDLRLNSALNQPFQAEIPLRDAGSLSNEQVTIKLASVDDFEKAGVDYSYLLSNLVFTVSLDGNGDGVVTVKSRDPIVEPYLNFLVEARWPAGRMLREYTVLLDLPSVSDAKSSAVRTAQGGAAAQAAREVPATRDEVVMLEETLESEGSDTGPKPRADGARTNLPKSERPTEYRVQHNDMLWNLASEFKPEGATVHQTMLALLRKNPRAFIGDNINRLKSGYVLRLPTAEEARSIGQDDALKEVRRQNAVWRGEALPSDGDLDSSPQLDATGSLESEETPAARKPDARLSIATPGQSDSEGAGKDGSSQDLRDQLAAAQEESDRAERENAELNSRLGDLERQLATLQRLLELKDDQLATLQGQMGEEPAKPAAESQASDQAAPSDDGGGLLDNPMIRYGLMLIALLILLVLVLRRFGQNKTEAAFESAHFEEEADFDSDQGFDEGDDDPGHTTVIIEPRSKAEEPDDLASADDDFEDLDDLLADDAEADAADDLEVTQPKAPIEAETDDALAEADIYVAYGRYEQAAQMLSGAIAKEPERTDLRAKLLDVYLETRDKANFMREFEALEALGDSDAVSEVKESMSAVEGVSDWLRGDSAAAEEPPVEDPDLSDLDFNLDEPENEASKADDLDDAFELDIDEDDLDLTSDSDLSAAAPVTDESDSNGPALAPESDQPAPVDAPEQEDTDDIGFDDLDIDADDDLELSSFSLDDDEESDSGTTAVFDTATASPAPVDRTATEISAPEDTSENASNEGFDLDLDDDFSLDELDVESSVKELDDSDSDDLGELSLDDFELDEPEGKEPATSPETPAASETEDSLDDLSLDDELSLDDDPFAESSDSADAAASSALASDDFDELDADDMSDDLGLLGDSDEVATKLDLARAYIDMGDAEGAKDMLQEVLEEGTDEQKQDAQELLGRL